MTVASAFIFDLDGTLLDSLSDLAASSNNALQAMGFSGHEVDAYRYFVGSGIEELGRRALPETVRDEGHIQRFVTLMQQDYEQRWPNTTRPYEGILPLLTHCHERAIPIAVLSNKPHPATTRMVETLFPNIRFVKVLGARPFVPKKPHPQSALEIAQKMACDCSLIGFVGDSNIDMQTAKAAGMIPLGVLWGLRSQEELVLAGAQRLIHHPKELLALTQPSVTPRDILHV